MLFSGIGHMAIRCTDIDRSLDFYTRVLRLPEMFRLHESDGRLWLLYLKVNDSTFIELFPFGEGNAVPGKMATGFNHLCLETPDIEAVASRLEELGVPLLRPLTTGDDRNRQLWIEDPDGNRIEIMEMAPDALQFEALERLRAE